MLVYKPRHSNWVRHIPAGPSPKRGAQDDSSRGVEPYKKDIMSSKTNLINLRQQLRRARTIVVKVGTKVLVQPDGTVATEELRELVKSVGTLRMSGRRVRSEERRVGKECRSRWSPYH